MWHCVTLNGSSHPDQTGLHQKKKVPSSKSLFGLSATLKQTETIKVLGTTHSRVTSPIGLYIGDCYAYHCKIDFPQVGDVKWKHSSYRIRFLRCLLLFLGIFQLFEQVLISTHILKLLNSATSKTMGTLEAFPTQQQCKVQSTKSCQSKLESTTRSWQIFLTSSTLFWRVWPA